MNLKAYLSSLDPEKRERFAANCGTTKGHLQNIAYGFRTCATDIAVSVERESKGVVTRQELREDWAAHWPELAKRSKKQVSEV
jgi:DNA-binding transcriptional regulator YdaS (Cro superfamily)